jgi:hypothetical protein
MEKRNMKTMLKPIGVAVLAVLALLHGTAHRAQAQFNRNGRFVGGPVRTGSMGINRNPLIAPGLSLQQFAFNNRVAARVLSSYPPALFGSYLGGGYAGLAGYGGYPGIGPGYAGYGATYGGYSPYGGAYAGYGGSSSYGANPGYGGYGGNSGGSSNSYGSSGDPYSGDVRAGSSTSEAQGRLAVQLEQAKLTRERAKQARVATRRQLFDEILYERAHLPSVTDSQEQLAALRLRRSQGTPPVTEVYSGKALNDLLTNLKNLRRRAVHGPRIPLDPDMLTHINVRGHGSGNLGLLKHGGRFAWPLGLRDLQPADSARDVRNLLKTKAIEAVRQAESGEVSAGLLKDLRHNVGKLRRLLVRNITALSTGRYIEAKRFLNHFDEAIQALGQTDAGHTFDRTYTARGKTVEQLVDHMARHGLTFAPAVLGEEAAYRALHEALAAYSIALRPANDNRQEARSTSKLPTY